MTNPDGNAGETPPTEPGTGPSEPSPSGYEAPPIEQSQDLSPYPNPQPPTAAPPPFTPVDYPPPPMDYPADYPPYPDPSAFGGPQAYPPAPGYVPPPQYGASGYGAPVYGAPPSGYPAAGYPGAYSPGYPVAPANPTNSLAVGSLATSILSLPLLSVCGIGLFVAIVGIGLGIAGLNQIKQRGQSGHGLAVAGIAIGAVSALLNGGWLLVILAAMVSAA